MRAALILLCTALAACSPAMADDYGDDGMTPPRNLSTLPLPNRGNTIDIPAGAVANKFAVLLARFDVPQPVHLTLESTMPATVTGSWQIRFSSGGARAVTLVVDSEHQFTLPIHADTVEVTFIMASGSGLGGSVAAFLGGDAHGIPELTRTLTATNLAAAGTVEFDVPAFARDVFVYRGSNTNAIDVELCDSAGGAALATYPINAAEAQLMPRPIGRRTRVVRIRNNGAGAIANLTVIFGLAL